MTDKHRIPTRILREMKMISDQQGIMERYLAEAEGWKEHIEKTRAYILESVGRIRPSSILVCGSGWLLDLPMDELVSGSRELYLADIHHPVQVRRKTEKLPGCRLLKMDLTGGAVQGSYDYVKRYRKTGLKESLAAIPVRIPRLPFDPDLVISLNLLNQMDILLVDYIRRHIALEQDERAAFRSRIQKNHLDFLSAYPACLVSDTEEIIINRDGRETGRNNLIYSAFPAGKRPQSWIWRFDESGYYKRGMKTHMLVRAVEL